LDSVQNFSEGSGDCRY